MTEMLVTVLIALILAGIGAAGYRVYQRESPLQYAADRLGRAAVAARSYAVMNNTNYALQVHPKFQNFWIDELDPAGLDLVPPTVAVGGNKVVAPEAFGDKVQLTAAYFGVSPAQWTDQAQPVTIRFNPDGSSDDAQLWLRLGDASAPRYTAVRIYGPTGMSRVLTDVDQPTQTLGAAAPVPTPAPTPVPTP